MKHAASQSSALPTQSPAEAYASDLDRLDRSGPLRPDDDAWLVLAHTLHRFAELSREEIALLAPQSADMVVVSAMASGLSERAAVVRAAHALRDLFASERDSDAERDEMSALVFSTQAVAEEQELAGAFGLAFALLSGLLGALGPRLAPRHRGHVLTQQARAARQLGASDVARDLYDDAIQIGYTCEALDVVSRALLGLGVLATTRGNQPLARQHFERSLVNAERAADPELIRAAHHGLLNASLAADDLDAALVHGWNVLRLSIAPESRAEALMNMAEICRMSGEHDAAIRTYTIAMDWTQQRHVRLHALSGALQSCIVQDRTTEARGLLSEITQMLPTVTNAFSLAMVGVELAESLHTLGEQQPAVSALNAAMALATEHEFHKVIFRAEQVAASWHIAPSPEDVAREDAARRARPRRSPHFRMVLRSLHGLSRSPT
jgi:hypothetical protein